MKRDFRESPFFSEAHDIAAVLLRPASGAIVDATEVDVSADGTRAAIAAVIADKLEGSRKTRISLVDLDNGATKVLTYGPNSDRGCKFSPDGRTIAFLSDREDAGAFQLYLLDSVSGVARAAPRVVGWIEYLHWSDDGARILLAVAGHGADSAGVQGALSGKTGATPRESWLPEVELSDDTSSSRRSAWVYDVSANTLRPIPTPALNLWEMSWCGPSSVVAVVSERTDEGAWYRARLSVIDIDSGAMRPLYEPQEQIGWPTASPSGDQVAVVEGICSDRWCVAGNLLLINTGDGAVRRVSVAGTDICSTRWRSADRLLLAGRSGFKTLLLEYSVAEQKPTEIWSSDELSAVGVEPSPAPLRQAGSDCVFLGEGYRTAPCLIAIENSRPRVVRAFNSDAQDQVRSWIDKVERVTWTAPDGLEIQGWLLLPKGGGPFPLVMSVHGGPVAAFRPHWQGRSGTTLACLVLLRRGYAVFQPNPRGSSGRGQDFVRPVKGDLNGRDTDDYLSGLDELVRRGLADPHRLGVMGASYGGNMTCWLVTRDRRFAAAVPIAPHPDQVSQHLTSNIPEFDELFIGEKYSDPNGRYYQRSAIMFADRVTTPTLQITGALDRCTPASQALEFHNALRLHGVKSVLVRYPGEGHGIRQLPAAIDCAARIVSWFEEHMPSAPPTTQGNP